MSIDIDCPICGESEYLQGLRVDDHIDITCGNCGQNWQRSTSPVCPVCAGTDLQAVPLAIVENSRGTQLSVVCRGELAVGSRREHSGQKIPGRGSWTTVNGKETTLQHRLHSFYTVENAKPHFRRAIRVRLADLPGSLHRLTGLVSGAGVNIVRLETLSWDDSDVWDDIELASEDDGRLDLVVATLKAEGLTVVRLPDSWAMRDWAVEVLESLELLAGSDPVDAMTGVTDAGQKLTNTTCAFLLMEPQPPDARVAGVRWELIRRAANRFDPDLVAWSGEPMGVKIVTSAMHAARGAGPGGHAGDLTGASGAVVTMPTRGGRPGRLAVIGDRPPFLDAELKRLELYAKVSSPYVAPMIRERVGA